MEVEPGQYKALVSAVRVLDWVIGSLLTDSQLDVKVAGGGKTLREAAEPIRALRGALEKRT